MKNENTVFYLKCGYKVTCRSERTRYGFRHLATLTDNNFNVVGRSKACYYNRTWESFTYETVIRQVLQGCKDFDESAVRFIMEGLNNKDRERVNRQFGTVGAIAKLGELFTDNKKDSNDWKARMLKAGLPGLDMPDDWAALNEEEKEKRLNKVIEFTKTSPRGELSTKG